MREWQSQAQVKHYCKYHMVFVPKYRKKSIYGTLRKDIGGILRELSRQQGIELVEGYAMKDRIHMLLMIPPKFSVAHTIGFLKGKSAIRIFRDDLQVKRNFTGRHFLGPWLLRQHGRFGRADDPRVHQESGTRNAKRSAKSK